MIANDLLIGPSSPSCTAREVLRTLQDLDLGQRIALTPDSVVRIAGCLSRDEPVERGVRYLVKNEEGNEETLTLAWTGDELEVQLHGESRWRRLRTMLRLDSLGRTAAPELGARLDPRDPQRRAAERFMRRVVRAAYAA